MPRGCRCDRTRVQSPGPSQAPSQLPVPAVPLLTPDVFAAVGGVCLAAYARPVMPRQAAGNSRSSRKSRKSRSSRRGGRTEKRCGPQGGRTFCLVEREGLFLDEFFAFGDVEAGGEVVVDALGDHDALEVVNGAVSLGVSGDAADAGGFVGHNDGAGDGG